MSSHPSPSLPADHMIHTGVQALKPIPLTCPSVQGDFVQLYWIPPKFNKQTSIMKLVHNYDRWRVSTQKESKRIRLAGPPYSAKTGSFSFLLTPDLSDGGVYVCKVYLNDNVFNQSTTLSVLKGKEKHERRRTKLESRRLEPFKFYLKLFLFFC